MGNRGLLLLRCWFVAFVDYSQALQRDVRVQVSIKRDPLLIKGARPPVEITRVSGPSSSIILSNRPSTSAMLP